MKGILIDINETSDCDEKNKDFPDEGTQGKFHTRETLRDISIY